MKREFFVSMLALLLSCSAAAHDFIADSICYNIISEDDRLCEVTYFEEKSGLIRPNFYKDVIFVPERVDHEGLKYTVAAIGENAFCNNDELLSVVLPNTINEIRSHAFLSCRNMKSITIPSSVTCIESGAFCGLASLANIDVAEGNEVYDSRNGCNAIIESKTNTLLFGCRTTMIPDGVEVIASNAFWIVPTESTEPFAIDIPGSVRVIKDCAFQVGEWLSGVMLHEGLEEIGSTAFWGTSIESIVIPASVTKIAPSAFANTKQLKSIKVKRGNKVYDSRKGCNAIIESKNDRLIQGCSTTTVPKGIKAIARHAFKNVDVTELVIPSSVVDIESGAFFNSGLTGRLVIPANVKRIGERAFSCCNGIDELVVEEGVEEIGKSAFAGCRSLRCAKLPASLECFGSSDLKYVKVFDGCHLLEEIELPEENPNYYCYRNVIVEKSTLTAIASTGLGHSQLNIGQQEYRPKKIASGTFCDLNYLTAVWLPETLEEIEAGAFHGCPSIEFIYCAGKIPPVLAEQNFGLIHGGDWHVPLQERVVVIVPVGSLNAYRNAPGWKEFKRIIESR